VALQIYFLRHHSRTRSYKLVCACGFDATIAHCQCGNNATLTIHRDDVAATENEIGRDTLGCKPRNAKPRVSTPSQSPNGTLRSPKGAQGRDDTRPLVASRCLTLHRAVLANRCATPAAGLAAIPCEIAPESRASRSYAGPEVGLWEARISAVKLRRCWVRGSSSLPRGF